MAQQTSPTGGRGVARIKPLSNGYKRCNSRYEPNGLITTSSNAVYVNGCKGCSSCYWIAALLIALGDMRLALSCWAFRKMRPRPPDDTDSVLGMVLSKLFKNEPLWLCDTGLTGRAIERRELLAPLRVPLSVLDGSRNYRHMQRS